MKSFSIPLPPGFNYQECLRFLDRNSLECLHSIENETILKPFVFEDRLTIFEISKSGENILKVRILNSEINKNEKALVQNHISDWLDLETDLTGFYRLAAKDQILAPLINKFNGLPLVGIPDLFESLAWSIIGQQINLTFAYSLKRKLVENFGKSIHHGGHTFHTFPSTKVVSKILISELRELQYSQRKAEYLVGIAGLLENGLVSKSKLETLSFAKAKEELMSIRGIGNWTANYVLMKCLRIREAYPIEDVGLHNAIKAILKMDRKPNREELEDLGKKWGKWSAYATFYLWHSLVK